MQVLDCKIKGVMPEKTDTRVAAISFHINSSSRILLLFKPVQWSSDLEMYEDSEIPEKCARREK